MEPLGLYSNIPISEIPDFLQPNNYEPDAQLSRDQSRFPGMVLELWWPCPLALACMGPTPTCTTFPFSQFEPGRCCVLSHLKAMQSLSQHQLVFHQIKILLTHSVDKQIPKKPCTERKELQVYSQVNVYIKCCSNNNFRK